MTTQKQPRHINTDNKEYFENIFLFWYCKKLLQITYDFLEKKPKTIPLFSGTALDELSLGDLAGFDGSKSRKSSGFSSSDGTSNGSNGGQSGQSGQKSRQYSGYDMANKSRNCSGNSISHASLVSSGILNQGSAPVTIPSSSANCHQVATGAHHQHTGHHSGHQAGAGGPTGTSPKGGSPMQISNGIMSSNGSGGSDNAGENVSILILLIPGNFRKVIVLLG